ncbi:MAG: glycine--tRNA ligase subunit beta [Nitrospirota bacterium]
MNKTLLLEIGTEEIPARFIPPALIGMKESIQRLLNSYNITFGIVSTFATPRRLVVLVEGVAEHQSSSIKEVVGPARRIAFDDKGTPTKAAYGFAKVQGISVEMLKIKHTERGEYITAVFEEERKETRILLPEILTTFIRSITFPKAMRWMDKDISFARPVHWILALFENEIISFEIDGIRSGNVSRGHRFMSPGAFAVRDPKIYKQLMENNSVIIDPQERKDMIRKQIEELASSLNCDTIEDEELLTTVSNLVECPVAVLGRFERKYLELPRDVLINAMKEHQKYFPLIDTNGNLQPYFIVISNTKVEDMDIIRRGNERVLKARLDDASFYYEEDRSVPLWDRVDNLKQVVYHERLGSLYQKVKRMAEIASYITSKIDQELKEIVERASYLSKADLTTGIVGEFPKLQGIIGREYAILSGEKKEVADAIYEHYLPRFWGDTLPESKTGAIVGIADKIDTIAGFFSIGIIPTGSEDPYALRRNGNGVVQIILKCNVRIGLSDLVAKALQGFKGKVLIKNSLQGEIMEFLRQRAAYIFTSEGYMSDMVDAVLSAGFDDLIDVKERIEALSEFRKTDDLIPFVTVSKRVVNILPDGYRGRLSHKLLTEDAEKRLYRTVKLINKDTKHLIDRNSYTDFINKLLAFRVEIDNFFDNVLVMDKDEGMKNNRLALLGMVSDIFKKVADFSKIIV